jgi:hypothetical protein
LSSPGVAVLSALSLLSAAALVGFLMLKLALANAA